MAAQPPPDGRSYHILGVPLRSGSLYPGSENDAQAYRDARIVDRLRAAGCAASDDGDVEIPSYLPHHTVPPLRSWPGPRIAWECVRERVAPYLRQPGRVPLLIGCDCSVVVGTAQALHQVAPDAVHVLYVDGNYDDAPPDAERCQSAAAMALWLLTDGAPFRPGPPLHPSRVTVIGASEAAQSAQARDMGSLPLSEVRRLGAREAARRTLDLLPPSAAILLHVDVDVIQQRDMPAAYFPRADGLTWPEARDLIGTLLGDPSVRIVELSEYAMLRDVDRAGVGKLIDLLADGLRPTGAR